MVAIIIGPETVHSIIRPKDLRSPDIFVGVAVSFFQSNRFLPRDGV